MELYGKSAYEQNKKEAEERAFRKYMAEATKKKKEEAEEMEELTNITKIAKELAEVSVKLDTLRLYTNNKYLNIHFRMSGRTAVEISGGMDGFEGIVGNLIFTSITLLEARQKELRNELAL